MTSSEERFVEHWRETRAKGRRRYVVLDGWLAYGVPMFVVMTFFVNRPEHLTVDFIVVAAFLWSAGGVAFGLLTWRHNEKKYQRLQS